MAGKNMIADIEFSGPANYRIAVKGCIPGAWSERLSGLNIAGNSNDQAPNQVTVLEGRMSDQAPLMGALESLHHLHLPIISVSREADG